MPTAKRHRLPDAAYDAFISYSHAADGRLTPALRQGLQAFAKPWYRRRALRVFHDASNLSANPDLWQTVHTALVRSRAFILMASVDGAASPWVGREVEAWVQANHYPGTRTLRPDRPILIVLTDGEIAWSEAARDFDWSVTTALPRAMSGVFGAEPLWVDLRWARSDEQVSLRHPRFRDAVATLSATLRGKEKDDLLGEDVRLWRRARRLAVSATAALATLFVLAATLGGVALRQSAIAEAERDRAVEQERLALARALQAQAQEVRLTDPELSLRLGIAALKVDDNPDTHASLVQTILHTHFAGRAPLHAQVPVAGIGKPVAVGRGGTAVVIDAPSADGETVLTLFDTTDPFHPVRGGTLTGRTADVDSVAFSSDGRLLAIAAGSISLWDVADLASPRRLATVSGASETEDVAFAPDGRTLAAVGLQGSGGWLYLWDITNPATPSRVSTRVGDYDATDVGFSPIAGTLVTGSTVIRGDERTGVITRPQGFTVWDITDRQRPRPLTRIDGFSGTLALGGDLLAVTNSRHDVYVWNLREPADPALQAIFTGHGKPVVDMAFSPDARMLVSTSNDGTGILWDVPARQRAATLGGSGAAVLGAGFSADGTTFLTVDGNDVATRWRTFTGPSVLSRVSTEYRGVAAVATNPAGDLLAIGTVSTSSDLVDGTVELWTIADRTRPAKVSTLPIAGAGEVATVAFNADGTILATGTVQGATIDFTRQTGALTLWDVRDPAHPLRLTDLDIATDESGQPLPVRIVSFHPRLPVLAVTGGRVLGGSWAQVWDVSDPARPRSLGSATPIGMGVNAFSPDGTLLALPGLLLDVTEEGRLRSIEVDTSLDTTSAFLSFETYPAAIAPGNQIFVVGTTDRVTLWDIHKPAAARLLGQLGQHLDTSLNQIRLAADGRMLASTWSDGTVELWDISDPAVPALVFTWRAHTGVAGAQDLVFAPDESWFATGGGEGDFALWEFDLPGILADPAAAACAIAGSGLTRDQWAEHIGNFRPYQQHCQQG